MNASTPSPSSSPCGCGGAHASTTSSSGCGCGCGGQCGGAPADCRDGGAIVRPLFFAGQLLTEEDLQALSAYVAAKSRLHNRDFFGEGVACGFEVVCHPCGGGKVIVRPGHALDCCGNDVVLSAAQTLDVNALVRELRKTLQGGIDCGDPCADPAHSGGPQRYGLFVRYCETLTDPVSAFVTDEPCGTAACEPTRVREGLRFELRCSDKADPSRDALCRIAGCLGDAGTLKSAIDDLTVLDRVIQESEQGLALAGSTTPLSTDDLKKSADDLKAATPADDLTLRTFRNLVPLMDVVGARLDRFNKADTLPANVSPALSGAALKLVKFILDHLKDPDPTPLERSFTRKVVERADAAFKTASAGTELNLWTLSDTDVPEIGSQLDVLLCSLFDKLRARLDGTPEVTVCELSSELRNLVNLCPATPHDFSTAIDLARKLRDATWHSLQDCICPAVLPPCPECHDPGVQLASLEVQSCEVVRICNLERTLVATPVALRHWLPLRELQQIAAALCCRDLGHLDLATLLSSLCPSTKDLATLGSAFRQLRELIIEHEPSLPFLPSEQAARNADFEKRLEALEGRKTP